MKFLLIIGSIVVPLLMIFFQKKWLKLSLFYNLAALMSSLIFGNISSVAIYSMIKNNTVFMTTIHGIFLNPLFLLTGAYLGVYFIYRLELLMLDEMNKGIE